MLGMSDPRVDANAVTWRAVMAGVTVAVAAQLLLTLIGAAIGTSAFDPTEVSLAMRVNGTMRPALSPAVGLFTGTWSLVAVVTAMFAGGYVAGAVAPGSARTATIHGVLVWSVALLASLWFVAIGITAVFSLIGAGAAADPNRIIPTVPQAAAATFGDVNRWGMLNGLHRASALWTLVGVLILAALASVLGARVAAARTYRTSVTGLAEVPRRERVSHAGIA